jgi:hypothetical protein
MSAAPCAVFGAAGFAERASGGAWSARRVGEGSGIERLIKELVELPLSEHSRRGIGAIAIVEQDGSGNELRYGD